MENERLIGTEVHGPLTVEQAQMVELPSFLHPIERIRTIGRLASETSGLRLIGFGFRNQIAYTRKGLIEAARVNVRTDTIRQQVSAVRARINADKEN